MSNPNPKLMLGYDYELYVRHFLKVNILASLGHWVIVGGSGSGKSTSVLYWLYKLRNFDCILYIADFKKSKNFCGISNNFAEFEDCYDLIKRFYEDFLSTPEGGDCKGTG